MNSKFFVAILAIFALAYSAHADVFTDSKEETSSELSFHDNNFYQGSNKIAIDLLKNIVMNDEEAYSEFKIGNRINNFLATPLACIGGFSLGFGLARIGNEEGKYIALGGVGVTALAFLFSRISLSYFKSSMEIYNNNLTHKKSTWDSVRLDFVPTQQGGIALAFSF